MRQRCETCCPPRRHRSQHRGGHAQHAALLQDGPRTGGRAPRQPAHTTSGAESQPRAAGPAPQHQGPCYVPQPPAPADDTCAAGHARHAGGSRVAAAEWQHARRRHPMTAHQPYPEGGWCVQGPRCAGLESHRVRLSWMLRCAGPSRTPCESQQGEPQHRCAPLRPPALHRCEACQRGRPRSSRCHPAVRRRHHRHRVHHQLPRSLESGGSRRAGPTGRSARIGARRPRAVVNGGRRPCQGAGRSRKASRPPCQGYRLCNRRRRAKRGRKGGERVQPKGCCRRGSGHVELGRRQSRRRSDRACGVQRRHTR